jgi:glycosyltransferase involved in cell wall biosynthesis
VPRVLAFIEALGVTGPVGNLLRTAESVDLHLATYRRATAGRAHHAGIDALVDAARARHVPVHVLTEGHAFDPALLFRVARTIRHLAPDVVQSHNIKSHALVACARGRRRWVAFHHGYTDTNLKQRVYNRVDRWALRRADAIVTPCSAFADELTKAGVDRRRITVLHNAVESPRPIETGMARRALRLESDYAVVAIGRLSREKGHDVLIDACAALPPSIRERTLLVIAGDGPERAALIRRAAARRVRLRLDGFHDDVRAWYAAADVFVLPSRSEGSPNVLLEAFAAGCAVVASRVGGIPEIADAGASACLVPPEHVQELAAAIEAVLTAPDLACRLREGARRAAARFTPDARVSALQALYAQVQA